MEDKERIQKIVDDYQMNNIVNPNVDPESVTLADTVKDINIDSLPSSLQFDGVTDIDDDVEADKLAESINKRKVTRFFEELGVRDAIKKYIKAIYDESNGSLEYHDFEKDGYFSFDDFNERGFNKGVNLDRNTFINNIKHFFYKGKFDSTFNDTVGMKSANSKKSNEPEVVKPKFNVEDSSDKREIAIFNKMHAPKGGDSDVANRVRLKYEAIEDIARNVASGESALPFGLIAGDPGIGKTYCIEKAVEEGLKRWTPNARSSVRPTLVKISGSIGSSFTDVVTFFYQNRESKLIILDDADGFLLSESQDVQNLMKGLFDEKIKKIHVPPIIINRINSNLAKEFEAEKAEREAAELSESKNPNIKMDIFGNIITMKEGKFDNDNIFGAVENFKNAQIKKEVDAEKLGDVPPKIRNDFEFKSNIIFISNLELNQLDSAVLSRTDHFAINLTEEEFICRAEQILSTMVVGRYSSTNKDIIEWSKKESFAYLKIVLINKSKYSDFNAEINCTLTFRLIPELTNIYLRHVLRYCRKEKIDMNDPKNRPIIQDMVQDDFIFDLLSVLKTDTRKK